MKNYILVAFVFVSTIIHAQERVVYVDFESSSFKNSPTIPYNKPFAVEGQVYRDVEYVEVVMFHQNGDTPLHSFIWNRDDKNPTETFNLVIPGILTSNSKYDFKIVTYKRLSPSEKKALTKVIENRVHFYLSNILTFNGTSVEISNPNKSYNKLIDLVRETLKYERSKNNLGDISPSTLVLAEMKNYENFKFKKLLKKTKSLEKDKIANQLIEKKLNSLTELIMAELYPFLSSDLVRQHNLVEIKSVATDKERFSIPINAGMYAWSKETNINNATVNNIDFTPGVGITIPFASKSSLLSNSKSLDSFGFSLGVLVNPVKDASGLEFITPGVNLPVYTALGLRMFKVVRLNAGVLLLADKGMQNFSGMTIIPTVGLALELNLWMGIKK
tara:strand:+ start:81869 stop:83029 length:1161 start_codon:yes stop_codon:yes gene_type:complete